MELNGRNAVVTGAASGIGLALTERFLAEGMSVVMADIEADKLESEADRLAADGARVSAFECDVSDPAQVRALRERAVSDHGAVHVLCNNAGVALGARNLDTSAEQWQWVIGVNVLGAAYGCSEFGPLMVEQGEGHILNTSSEAGLCSTPMLGSYHASKYAVVGLSESLAMELDGTGVGVSVLCPELVDTQIFESTRNAPAELGLPRPRPVPLEKIEEFMGSKAMAPSDVAGKAVYAIRQNNFWIITHPVTETRYRLRNRDMESATNPRFRMG